MNPDHYYGGGPERYYDGPGYNDGGGVRDAGRSHFRDGPYHGEHHHRGGHGGYYDGPRGGAPPDYRSPNYYDDQYHAGPQGPYDDTPRHHHHNQRNHYNSPYGEEEKVEVVDPSPPSAPRHQSALDECMLERTRRHPSTKEENNKKPGAFYDSAYDDVLARKQAEYAPPRNNAQRDRSNDTMIELGPGMYARLRGASETWSCVENDYHDTVTCFACNQELCCIRDADYVLCPKCKVVSPLENSVGGGEGGVGLGFTYDELFQWQAEIMRRRAETRAAPPQAAEAYC